MQSVERAFSILESFDERHPARTAADIAETAGLARPTTYRMLQTLRRLGYVRNINGKFEARLVLPLSLSYDHRLIDGADAARFLRWIAEAFEQPFLLSVQG